MTIFEGIKKLDEEAMAEFLYVFARDTVDLLASRFRLPDRNEIREFLEREKPEA